MKDLGEMLNEHSVKTNRTNAVISSVFAQQEILISDYSDYSNLQKSIDYDYIFMLTYAFRMVPIVCNVTNLGFHSNCVRSQIAYMI